MNITEFTYGVTVEQIAEVIANCNLSDSQKVDVIKFIVEC